MIVMIKRLVELFGSEADCQMAWNREKKNNSPWLSLGQSFSSTWLGPKCQSNACSAAA